MTEVAQTILEQLGGGMFLLLTGAKDLVGGDNRLTMTLPDTKHGRHVKCVIELTPMDDYTIKVGKMRYFDFEVIEKAEGVYCDTLKDNFEEMTGLYVTLHARA